MACKNTANLNGVKLQDGSGRVCYSATCPGSVAAYICENAYSGNHTDVTVCGTNLTWINPKTCVGELERRLVTVYTLIPYSCFCCVQILYRFPVDRLFQHTFILTCSLSFSIHTHTCKYMHTCTQTYLAIAIISPPSGANMDGLSEDGRVATYSCDSALYELEGSSSIIYDEENGWPDAPTCKGSL